MSTLSRIAVNDEGFMFDPQTGESYLLNETGRQLLEGLKEGLGEEELAGLLEERWNLSSNQAGRDVAEFLQQLRLLRLLP